VALPGGQESKHPEKLFFSTTFVNKERLPR
jgi:hypothetical protein